MKKYYDILESGRDILWFPALGLIALIICATSLIIFLKMNRPKHFAKITALLTALSFLWSLIWWFASASKYYDCVDSIKTKTYSTVEGYVMEFNPMPKEGHQDESFKVKGVKFAYSDYNPSCGFNNSKSHGGPIDEGKYLKINYYKGIIIQLWIKE